MANTAACEHAQCAEPQGKVAYQMRVARALGAMSRKRTRANDNELADELSLPAAAQIPVLARTARARCSSCTSASVSPVLTAIT